MLAKALIGPLFGAALASAWWAWAIWGDGEFGPGGDHWDLLLVVITAAYGVVCIVCGVRDLARKSAAAKGPDE